MRYFGRSLEIADQRTRGSRDRRSCVDMLLESMK